MGELGQAVIAALRDQGWQAVVMGDEVYVAPPAQHGEFVPVGLFEAEDDFDLRLLVALWSMERGFVWPWPPDLEPEDFDLNDEDYLDE
jgi:hypothetical protein